MRPDDGRVVRGAVRRWAHACAAEAVSRWADVCFVEEEDPELSAAVCLEMRKIARRLETRSRRQ